MHKYIEESDDNIQVLNESKGIKQSTNASTNTRINVQIKSPSASHEDQISQLTTSVKSPVKPSSFRSRSTKRNDDKRVIGNNSVKRETNITEQSNISDTFTEDEGSNNIITRIIHTFQSWFSTSHQPTFQNLNKQGESKSDTVLINIPHRYQGLLLLNEDDDEIMEDSIHTRSQEFTSFYPNGAFNPFALSPLELNGLLRTFFQSTWILLLVVAITASTTAWSVDVAVNQLILLHNSFTAYGNGTFVFEYALHCVFRVFILLAGVAVTMKLSAISAGSGIPEMRSILGGFTFPNYLTMRALIAKSVGLILALGSGLSIGKEGPFVHLSCIIAHQLLRFPYFKQIRLSKDLTQHIMSAACAVGVTATFGTPIGGVLFSIEVTTTYYITSNYWRAFFSSVVSVVVFRVLNYALSGTSGALFNTKFALLPYESYEIVWFLILATLCGVGAASFVRTYRWINANIKKTWLDAKINQYIPTSAHLTPILYAGLVALTFGIVEFPVGSFMRLSQRDVIDDMFSTEKKMSDTRNSHLNQKFPDSSWDSPYLALNLIAFVTIRFLSTAISATVMVPSGIVTPVFAIGAAFGRLYGEIVVVLGLGGGMELAGGYAIVGAASFTAGVTGTVSIAVIVFELTSQLSYMVPVLLCVLVSRGVALFFSLDIFETISRERKLPQWPDLTKQSSYGLVASDLMRPAPSYYILRHQTLEKLKSVINKTPKHVTTFPIVDDETTMLYLGVVDREELASAIDMWEICQDANKSLVTDVISSYASHQAIEKEILHNNPSGGLFHMLMDSDNSTQESESSPRSRHLAITTELAIAGLTNAQKEAFSNIDSHSNKPIDLVALDLLSLDAVNFHVHRDTFASHVILLISVHKSPQLFVTAKGKLLGVIHASDLLAKSRRYHL